jgi:cytochrome c553
MKTALVLILTLLSAPWQLAQAEPATTPTNPTGIGSKDYVWGAPTPERAAVLKLKGDATRGKEAFRVCRGCHKNDAAGRTDGTYPRLTGQHASVIIKQVTDVRAGIRINPKMEPFAGQHAVSVQEIADIAVFLAAAESTRQSGKGDGEFVALGEKLYKSGKCIDCHGAHGEGDSEKVYPVVAAQHYAYLNRQMDYIQKGIRGNSHPDMVAAIKDYKHEELEAISDYLSRLPDYREAVKK